MGVMAEINGKPAFYNGNPMMFKNYLTESIIEFWNMDNSSGNLSYFWYPSYNPGDQEQLFIEGKRNTCLSNTGTYNNQNNSNNNPTFYSDSSLLISTLSGPDDWSISLWYRRDLNFTWAGASPNPYVYSYFTEPYSILQNFIIYTKFAFGFVSTDISTYYVMAPEGWDQQYPSINEYYDYLRKDTCKLWFVSDGLTKEFDVPNIFADSKFHHLVLRRKELEIEIILDYDIENSIKINTVNSTNTFSHFMVLSGNNDLSGYNKSCGAIDELFVFRKWITDKEIRRLYLMRNIF